MENKNNKNFFENLSATITKEEVKSARLGMEIYKLQHQFYYKDLVQFLQGENNQNGALYFDRLKPLYDKFGYGKVNRLLLALEERKEEKSDE